MSLGTKLQKARIDRNMTISQVAAVTRMKAQLVEALENDDFSDISAPIYAKGFLKLYAGAVGIDAKPLIDEYIRNHASNKAPSLITDGPPMQAPVHVGGGATLPTTNRFSPDELGSVPAKDAGGAGGAADPVQGDWSEESARQGMRTSTSPIWQDKPAEFPIAAGPLKIISIIVGIALLLVFLLSGLGRFIRKSDSDVQNSAGSGTVEKQTLRVAVQPPEPYVD